MVDRVFELVLPRSPRNQVPHIKPRSNSDLLQHLRDAQHRLAITAVVTEEDIVLPELFLPRIAVNAICRFRAVSASAPIKRVSSTTPASRWSSSVSSSSISGDRVSQFGQIMSGIPSRNRFSTTVRPRHDCTPGSGSRDGPSRSPEVPCRSDVIPRNAERQVARCAAGHCRRRPRVDHARGGIFQNDDELAAVMGRVARGIAPELALDIVLMV